MSYNWIKADTAEARERLKELLDKGNFVIAKKGFGPNRLAELSVSLCKNEYMVNGKTSPMPFDDLVYLIEDGEFLDPNPIPACPPLRWEKDDDFPIWRAKCLGIEYRIVLTSTMSYVTQGFDNQGLYPAFTTFEEAQAACQDHWEKLWAEEMGRMQPWPES